MSRKQPILSFPEVYEGLKDFQRTTVDYVFGRMYLDDPPARRFLVADEVGLGKTLVARGVIAKAVEKLQHEVERIDVVYICSNGDIARQNVKRLSLPGFADAAFSSRLTLLPLQLKGLDSNRLNFVSFTPGTAFELTGGLGRQDERALIFWMLKRAWPDIVGQRKGAMRVFQGDVGSFDRFAGHVKWMEKTKLKTIDRTLQSDFRAALTEHDRRAAAEGRAGFAERYEELAAMWSHKSAAKDPDNRRARNTFVGDLRSLLARTCITALEPDLVILDEFQRFKHLLNGESEASELAHHLFDHADDTTQARVLMLSATPYKMYTLSEEREDDDHFADFIGTASFLLNGQADILRVDLSDMQRHLLHLDRRQPRPADRRQEQGRDHPAVGDVSHRTTRLSADRNGMLQEVTNGHTTIKSSDLLNYVTLDRAARQLDAVGQVEFWKSAPYFPNFWHDYQIGRRYGQAVTAEWEAADTVQAMLATGETLIPWNDVRRYRRVDPGNGRLRGLISDLEQAEAWKLLWLPPSLPYHRLSGPFRTAFDAGFTKRLVFSSWGVVPKVVSTLVSYDAERRMMTAPGKAKVVQNTAEEPGRPRRAAPVPHHPDEWHDRLRLRLSEPRSGPTHRPQTHLGPARQRREEGHPQQRPCCRREGPRADRCQAGEAPPQLADTTDDRWYWAAPILMDAERRWPFANGSAWLVKDSRSGGAGFDKHLDLARSVHADPASLGLGKPPKDLVKVLALLGTAGPANAALRAFERVDPRCRTSRPVRRRQGCLVVPVVVQHPRGHPTHPWHRHRWRLLAQSSPLLLGGLPAVGARRVPDGAPPVRRPHRHPRTRRPRHPGRRHRRRRHPPLGRPPSP